jgi:hypothetical protein
MRLLKKIENDDRGLDISLFGTAMILMTFVSFCSIFDYWVITFAKEQLISKVEIYEFNALATHVDFTEAAKFQDFEKYYEAVAIESKVEDTFCKAFENGIGKSNSLIYNVGFVHNNKQVSCHPNPVTKKIVLESGPIRFQIRRTLKGTSNIPFMGGKGEDYLSEAVYTSVTTNIILLLN